MNDILKTPIEDLLIFHPFHNEDNRGGFTKYFEKDIYASLCLPCVINETFITVSHNGVVRGMHFQTKNPQHKFVTVLSGEVYDVAIDLRKNSKTFGKWYGIYLNSDNKNVFSIPAGFAHGFQVTSKNEAIVQYQCCGKYDKESDSGIYWNDRELNINWPIKDAIVSDKDKNLIKFSEFKRIGL